MNHLLKSILFGVLALSFSCSICVPAELKGLDQEFVKLNPTDTIANGPSQVSNKQ